MKLRIALFSRSSGINFGDVLISECSKKIILNSVSANITQYDLLFQKFTLNDAGDKKPTRRLALIFKKILNKFPFFFKKNFRRFYAICKIFFSWKKFSDSDVIFVSGGQILVDDGESALLWSVFALALFSKFFKKKLIIYSVGLGNVSFISKFILQFISSVSLYLSLRDTNSLSKLYSLTNKCKCQIDYDPVFSCSSFYKIPEINKEHTKKFFLVNVMDAYEKFGVGISDLNQAARNLKLISNVCSLDIRIVVTSFDRDLQYSLQLYNLLCALGCKVEFLILDSVDKIATALSNVSFSLCFRMHSAIISSSYDIPVLIYPWDKKIKSILVDDLSIKVVLLEKLNFNCNEIISKKTQNFVKNKINNIPSAPVLHTKLKSIL